MSKLGFGFMRLPVTNPADEASIDLEKTQEMVDLYMSRGGNYFDTAYRYCEYASEPTLQKTLTSRYPRSSYELTDKITLGFISSEEEQEPFFRK